MEEKKTNKLHEIRGTISDASEIMRQMSAPGVLESLNKVKETATQVNEIIQGLKTPEMVKNIENFRLISENMNETSTKMQNTVEQLKETGVIDETSEIIRSVKGQVNMFSENDSDSISGQHIRDVTVTTKEMLASIKDLVNELTLTVACSQKSMIIQNVQESIQDASEIYKTVSVRAD